MKIRTILIVVILLVSGIRVMCKEPEIGKEQSQTRTIKLFTSPDLVPMTNRWIAEYQKLNPQVTIELNRAEGVDLAGQLNEESSLGILSDELLSTLKNKEIWNTTVGRDVIVPIMNQDNPFSTELSEKGITRDRILQLVLSGEKKKREVQTENTQHLTNILVNHYYINEKLILKGLESYTGIKQIQIRGTQVSGAAELVAAIQRDPNGVGFCRILSITNQESQTLPASIKLIPIDKNGNGKIDYSEAIYTNLPEFMRGVWIGKYPLALSRKIYTVAMSKPGNEAELSFIKWILTDGQQYLAFNGFNNLVNPERQAQLDKINEPFNYATTIPERSPILFIKFLILLVAGLLVIILEPVVAWIRVKQTIQKPQPVNLINIFNHTATEIPKGLYFDKTHTWAFMKKDGEVKLGIDDFLQHVTGPLTRVSLLNAGERIQKGGRLVTLIQKGKQLTIYSPITGTIKEHNKNLEIHSSLLNSAPFTEGWIYAIEPTNWSLEIQFMDMAEKYKNWLKTEYSRLKDFFANAVRIHAPAFVMVLQDGGVLRDGILSDLGPEVWEDFQIKFIDKTV